MSPFLTPVKNNSYPYVPITPSPLPSTFSPSVTWQNLLYCVCGLHLPWEEFFCLVHRRCPITKRWTPEQLNAWDCKLLKSRGAEADTTASPKRTKRAAMPTWWSQGHVTNIRLTPEKNTYNYSQRWQQRRVKWKKKISVSGHSNMRVSIRKGKIDLQSVCNVFLDTDGMGWKSNYASPGGWINGLFSRWTEKLPMFSFHTSLGLLFFYSVPLIYINIPFILVTTLHCFSWL